MRGFVATVRAHPSAVLLAAQLFAVVLYPFLDQGPAGRGALGALQIAILVLAAAAVRPTPVVTWVAALLGGPALVLSILEAASPETGWVVVASAAFHMPFYVYVSYALVRYLFHDDLVTRDELFATGAAFTVVAWAFAYLYAAAQVIWPGSFTGYGGEGDRPWFDLLFLSFTVLTSVGLSDVVPVQEHARSLVVLEEIVGVFYIALVVARLVGLTNRDRPTS